MANLDRNPRKRTLNSKLSSTDNVSLDAANLKRQKIHKGAVTAATSKRRQGSVQDSDEDDNSPRPSHFRQPKNPRAENPRSYNPRAEKGAVTTTTSKKYQVSVQDSDEEDDDVPKPSRFQPKKPTTSTKYQVSVQDSDEEDDDVPKPSRFQPKNPTTDRTSDDDIEMLDGDRSMPASSVIDLEDDVRDLLGEDVNQAELEHLKKQWKSPVYSFFYPDVKIEVSEAGRVAHVFKCSAVHCTGKGKDSRLV